VLTEGTVVDDATVVVGEIVVEVEVFGGGVSPGGATSEYASRLGLPAPML